MLKCVLLDSNIVIEAYRLGIWEKLIKRVEISVSSIVAHTESLFYVRKEGRIPDAINLRNLIAESKIKEFTASSEDLSELYSRFDRVFIEGIHNRNVMAKEKNISQDLEKQTEVKIPVVNEAKLTVMRETEGNGEYVFRHEHNGRVFETYKMGLWGVFADALRRIESLKNILNDDLSAEVGHLIEAAYEYADSRLTEVRHLVDENIGDLQFYQTGGGGHFGNRFIDVTFKPKEGGD